MGGVQVGQVHLRQQVHALLDLQRGARRRVRRGEPRAGV